MKTWAIRPRGPSRLTRRSSRWTRSSARTTASGEPGGEGAASKRKRAIPLHGLHHVATGYATTFRGEAEIGAWEIAAGCSDHWAAWVLDASAFAYGLVLAPRRVYRAFVRGRHSRSLYRTGWNDRLLEITVDELRSQLDLAPATAPATWTDRLAFAGWVTLVTAPALGLGALAVALLR